METLSFVVLILLSLVGYSAGAVGKAGRFVELKPKIIDLILVIFIWGGAVYFRIEFDFNKWLLILIWVILGSIIGILAIWPRELIGEKAQSKEGTKVSPLRLPRRLWQRWKEFSNRMGSFQSRMMLSFFFFVFVSPFALAVKIFSDPLQIKPGTDKSHWLPKKEIKTDLEQFRKQF